MGHNRVWRSSFRVLGALLVPLLGLAVFSFSSSSASTVKENLDLPFDALGEAGEEEAAPEVVVFYGQVYEADALFFALDESGSMDQQGRWRLQTREVIRTVSELSQNTEFGIVYYSNAVSSFREAPVRATEGIKGAAKNYVLSRHPRGDTCLAEGVVKALQIAALSTSKRRAVIVTSDGKPDICATGDEATGEGLEALIQKTVNANPGLQVKVHTVWVGQVNEAQPIEFMKRLARAHGGTFRQVSG
jgi:hypothetical protein